MRLIQLKWLGIKINMLANLESNLESNLERTMRILGISLFATLLLTSCTANEGENLRK